MVDKKTMIQDKQQKTEKTTLTTISETVNEKIDKFNSQLELKKDIEQEKAKLKTLSECELLETYNRPDNIKTLGLELNWSERNLSRHSQN